MNYQIEIYRGEERELFGVTPFTPIVRQSLEDHLRRDLGRAFIEVTVLNLPEDVTVSGLPVVDNIIPEFAYTYVTVYLGDAIIYRHPHPLSDIVTRTLQKRLGNAQPDVEKWRFRVDIPGMPRRSTMRATPRVEGSVTVRPYERGEKPGFTIRRIAEAPPPEKRLGDFGAPPAEKDKNAMVKVVMPEGLLHDFKASRPLSDRVEEGGFLVGKVYRDGDVEGAHILEINVAPAAEYTGASFFHFTFTGDSFTDVKRTLNQDRTGERILGWYHTHLFPATVEMGLTSIDLTLHFGTFTFPWQVAGLINLDGGGRTLRFYVRRGETMILCPYWGIHERD